MVTDASEKTKTIPINSIIVRDPCESLVAESMRSDCPKLKQDHSVVDLSTILLPFGVLRTVGANCNSTMSALASRRVHGHQTSPSTSPNTSRALALGCFQPLVGAVRHTTLMCNLLSGLAGYVGNPHNTVVTLL